MKSKGIIFTGESVRAILAGTKTVTRRVMKPQPTARPEGASLYKPHGWRDAWTWPSSRCRSMVNLAEAGCLGPYGVTGGALWVRETWHDDLDSDSPDGRLVGDDGEFDGIEYRATHDCTNFEAGCPCNPDGDGKRSEWKSPLFMPRWASRITLRVESVRIELLHAITEEDARAEGVVSWRIPADDYGPERIGYVFGTDDGKCVLHPTAVRAFERGWDVINGKRAPWASNPWVWRVEFARVRP